MMPGRADMSSILAFGAGTTLLSACAAQPRLYSVGEFARVADRCGVATSELAQIGESLDVLYLLTPEPSDDQLVCVARWARHRNLKLVYVEEVVREPEPTEH